MVKIRLQRRGRRGAAHYRVVVAQASKSQNSKYIEDLGFYNPNTDPYTFEVDIEKVKEWLKKGAQPTDTVAQFLVKEGVLDTWRKTKASTLPQPKKKKKAPEEEAKPEKKEEKEEKKAEPQKESKKETK